MASFKIKFRPSSNDGDEHEGSLYYSVIHERKTRRLPTDLHIYPSEWTDTCSMTKIPRNLRRSRQLLNIRLKIRRDMERLAAIDRRLESTGLTYTADDITEEFRRYMREYTLFNFMNTIIRKLQANGKLRTSETYAAALRSFSKFRADKDIMLDDIDSRLMEDFEAWHHNRGNTDNTISFYLRILRAVYNRAVDDGIIENRNPFRRVYTGIDKTVKRALPLQTIKEINNLDLESDRHLDFARDMFMLSFMLRGMSFVDMAYLRKIDLAHSHIIYRRRKTGQQLTIEWTADMQRILDKYPVNLTGYLLPIIRKNGINERYAYRNAAYNINRNLKTVAKMVGISIPLTLYVARHSWASAARSKGIPLSVISEGMGHESETTTRIYLATIDTTAIDRANSLILKSI